MRGAGDPGATPAESHEEHVVSAVTLSPARPASPALGMRLRRFVERVRWTPAPRVEGSPARRLAYVGYLVGSMVAWVLVGLGVSALLGALLS